jgi:hypothetical protein
MPVVDRSGKWVFWHVPKTGGCWVEAQMTAAGGKAVWGRHHPYDPFIVDTLDLMGGQLSPFSCVRNPWDWYVSRFIWHYTDKASRELFLRWLPFEAMPGNGRCTYEHRRVHKDAMRAVVATDRLAEGLPELLGYDLPKLAPVNTHGERGGKRVVYRDWYTDQAIDAVWSADRDLIDRYGFAPFTRSPQAVYYQERE